MSPSIIFVAGVHGVGKTTYCKELSNITQLLHYSASDIIRSHKKSALNEVTKAVTDAKKNQDLLLEGIDSLQLGNQRIILDGHFVLIQNNEITRLPLSTFKSLGIHKIILLCDQPEKIHQRITSRDNTNQFTVEFISAMQDQEMQYANEVAALFDIELELIEIIERL